MSVVAPPVSPDPALRRRIRLSERTAHGASSPCFHCGLPIEHPVRGCVQGEWRSFCCPGCEAVASAISDQGLSDYYRFRQARPDRAEAAAADLSIYDDEIFQQDFVRNLGESECEAGLLLEGVRCAACVWLIEESLKRLPGVRDAAANAVTRRLHVRWDVSRVQLSVILGRIAMVGYTAQPYRAQTAQSAFKRERRAWLWRLFVAAFGMMQVMMYALPAYIATDGSMTADIESLMRWASFLLTVPVVAYAALPFFQGALKEVRTRRFGMDFPVSLGIAVASGASVWATLSGTGEVYFDTVTMFVFVLLLGRFLELLARQRAGEALARLSAVAPNFGARLLDYPTSHASERIPVARFIPGDIALVKPGETVPADGVVLEGRSETDEALVSGESLPIAKAPGSRVLGGSINRASPLIVRVEQVGGASLLGNIVRMVERAASERQPLAELADRYAHRFSIVVLAAAAIAVVAWSLVDPSRALWIGAAVLVATCPCALSLATPVALTVATGELARQGLIVGKGHVIESLARATDVVFDKTGTLTVGALELVEVRMERGSEHEALAIAAALEAGSEHPIGQALRIAAALREIEARTAEGMSNEAGQGVTGRVGMKRYRVGRRDYAGPGAEQSSREDSRAECWLADETGPVARFLFADCVKAEARSLIASLEGQGKRVHLLSGDAGGAVQGIARELGIREVRGGATPSEKLQYVCALQREGRVVAMVGDGVNDAPVLAQADVSIAMGTGAALAQTHADAVLLNGSLERLEGAWRSAARCMMLMRQNLAWGFSYNLFVLPAAALGLVSPWLAAIGMSASSVLVVCNALRLRGKH